MFLVKFSALIIVSLALQIEAFHIDVWSKETPIEDATKILQKLNTTLQESSEKAIERLSEIEENFKHSAGLMVENAVQTIMKDGVKRQKQLKEIKENAKSRGANISECLGKNETYLLSLPEIYKRTMLDSSDRMIVANEEVFSKSVNEVQDKFTAVAYYQQEISNCAKAKSSDSCLDGIVDKMNADIESFPLQIDDVVKRAEEASISLISYLYPSIAATTTDYLALARKTIERISDCAKNKESLYFYNYV